MSDTRHAATLAQLDATIAGLVAVREWADAHPDIDCHLYQTTLIVHRPYEMSVADFTRLITDGAPLGSVRKHGVDDVLFVDRRFAGQAEISWQAPRAEVCELVVVGTETVTVPDPEALAQVPTVEVTRDITEWKCSPLLDGIAS